MILPILVLLNSIHATMAANYTIITQTGCQAFAGTNAKVFVSFTARDGQSLTTFLSSDDHFSRCSVDAFKMTSNVQLKEICRITIGHGMSMLNWKIIDHSLDNSGWYPDWFLNFVTIQEDQRSWTFPINQWLSKKRGDKHTIVSTSRCELSLPKFSRSLPLNASLKMDKDVLNGPLNDPPVDYPPIPQPGDPTPAPKKPKHKHHFKSLKELFE